MRMIDDDNYQIVDDAKDLSPLYGMEIVKLSQGEIDQLKEGKFLYITVNDEYTVLVSGGGTNDSNNI